MVSGFGLQTMKLCLVSVLAVGDNTPFTCLMSVSPFTYVNLLALHKSKTNQSRPKQDVNMFLLREQPVNDPTPAVNPDSDFQQVALEGDPQPGNEKPTALI